MASNNIRFTVTALKTKGKQGILKPDDDGYYPVNLGALNTHNSIGEYYVRKGAEELFHASSSLIRRITKGNLKAEEGHPVQEVGMSDNSYMYRVHEIREANVCGHFKSVVLDFDAAEELRGKTPQATGTALKHQGDMIPIVGWVKPAGPQYKSLELGLTNPNENVCFSVRGFTDDFFDGGVCYRVLKQIITWDRVTEPGLAIANKFDTAALESYLDQRVTQGMVAELLTPKTLRMATEDSKEIIGELVRLYTRDTGVKVSPAWKDW